MLETKAKTSKTQQQDKMIDFVQLSQDFLYQVKTNTDYEHSIQMLSEINPDELATRLKTDQQKTAFWINLYNAYFQIEAKHNKDLFENRKIAFFNNKGMRIAGHDLSLNTIEHGILRGGQWMYGFGYIKDLFPSAFEKTHQVEQMDYRLHFALNCGAISCPPIAFYSVEELESELELAELNFMMNESIWDEKNNSVSVSKILWFYRGDFGGKKGIIQLFKNHQIIPKDAQPKIQFKAYNWAVELDNYFH